jgi:hypothetical protein
VPWLRKHANGEHVLPVLHAREEERFWVYFGAIPLSRIREIDGVDESKRCELPRLDAA